MKYLWVLLAMLICIAGYLWHRENHQAIQRENARQQEESKRALAESKALMDAEILRRETETIRLVLGDEAAVQYDDCKSFTPTSKEDQARCDALTANMKSIQEHKLE